MQEEIITKILDIRVFEVFANCTGIAEVFSNSDFKILAPEKLEVGYQKLIRKILESGEGFQENVPRCSKSGSIPWEELLCFTREVTVIVGHFLLEESTKNCSPLIIVKFVFISLHIKRVLLFPLANLLKLWNKRFSLL